MILFNNTEIAFQSKSNKDLRKIRLLFSLLSKKWFVTISKFLFNISQKANIPVGWIIKPTVFKHFCGGENLEECSVTIQKLSNFNISAIPDYSIEATDNNAVIENTTQEIVKTIQLSGIRKEIKFSVFKPSALVSAHILEKKSKGFELNSEEVKELEKFRQRIDQLCYEASKRGIGIMIDAEYVSFQDTIDLIASEMMEKYNQKHVVVYNTLQMYRKDRLQYLKNSHKIAKTKNYKIGVKIVRGAYLEAERELAIKNKQPSPIHNTKSDTDRDFNLALEYSIQNISDISLFCATHNENSCQQLVELMEKQGISKGHSNIWFSQLYGMSDHISYTLANEGYNVTKYLPYGPIKKVMPYLLRRINENSSIKGQANRELEFIIQEIKRRNKYENR